MKKRFGLAAACLAALVLAGAGTDSSKPVEVTARDLSGRTVIVIGMLGKPVGKYMNVQGDYFGKPAMTKCGLYVSAIDTIERGMAIVLQVDDRGLAKPLEAGRRYRLRGYETGSFGGLVDDPLNPTSKGELQQRQSAGPYALRFETVFYVTKAEDLGPASGATPTPSATQTVTQPAAPSLSQVKLTAGMPRQQAEQLIEAATGVKSTYDLHAMDTSREVTYRQGALALIVQYKPGTPAPIIASPNGTTTGLPPVDAEVLSWRFVPDNPPPTSRPATPTVTGPVVSAANASVSGPLSTTAAAEAGPATQSAAGDAQKAVEKYLKEKGLPGLTGKVEACASPELKALLPDYTFVLITMQRWPVARMAPTPLQMTNIFIVDPKAAVTHCTSTADLQKFFVDKLPTLKVEDQLKAATAWATLDREFYQDGMYKFTVGKPEILPTGGQTTQVRVVVSVDPAGGDTGEITSTLAISPEDKLFRVTDRSTLKAGMRPEDAAAMASGPAAPGVAPELGVEEW